GGLSRWKYARPRRFIAVSDHVKSVLIGGGVGPERISVIYDGVPLLPSSQPADTIVAPASSDPKKGTALALEAARIAGATLCLATDLEIALRAAGLFVYITHSEGLGSGILLAMSAGVPVVASRVGGIPEIIEHEHSGLLVENDPQDIARAILRLRQ